MQSCLKFRLVFPGNPTIFKNDHTFPRVVHLFESNTISEPSIVAPRPETSRPSCNPYSAAGFDPANESSSLTTGSVPRIKSPTAAALFIPFLMDNCLQLSTWNHLIVFPTCRRFLKFGRSATRFLGTLEVRT